jgi:Arc/MetJ family transcription regulator
MPQDFHNAWSESGEQDHLPRLSGKLKPLDLDMLEENEMTKIIVDRELIAKAIAALDQDGDEHGVASTLRAALEQRETIEIELPCYYKHELLLDDTDSVIYGKIEVNQCTTIQVRDDYRGAVSFELEVAKRGAASTACYMADEYKSNEGEYLAAKAKLIAAAQNA